MRREGFFHRAAGFGPTESETETELGFGFGPGPRGRARWAGGPEAFRFWFGGGPRRWGGWEGPRGGRGRPFGRGDLKYVILELIAEQPRHGYDVIRALGDRFHGFYTPSAGAVYPILQLLEDQGYVTSQEVDGKRIYTITDEGRRFLEERGDALDDLRSRVGAWWDSPIRAEAADVMREMAELGRLLVTRGRLAAAEDPGKLAQIKAVLARARAEVEAIVNAPPAAAGSGAAPGSGPRPGGPSEPPITNL